MATCSKKDYAAIAAIVKSHSRKNSYTKDFAGQAHSEGAIQMGLQLAAYFEGTNPKFNKVKFFKACGFLVETVDKVS